MQSRDHDVLVVARIAQQRAVAAVAVGHPGNVLVRCVVRSRSNHGSDLQLRANRAVAVIDVQVRAQPRAAPEHRIEIERRSARVRRAERVLRHPQLRSLIKRDVVIGELTNERRPRRHRRVIRIAPVCIRGRRVAIHRRIDDQRLRPRRQIILRVQDPALVPDLEERRPDRVIRLGKRRQIREDPPKVHARHRRPGLTVHIAPRRNRPHVRNRRTRQFRTAPDRAGHQSCTSRSHALQELPPRRNRISRACTHRGPHSARGLSQISAVH